MAPDPVARLAQLMKAARIDDDQEVYDVATAAAKADKSNLNAQLTRVVALLKLDRFNDALRVLAEAGTKAEETCRHQKAYALYKTGQLDEALELLQPLLQTEKPERSIRHLAAQVAYKAERFSMAADQYVSLVADRDESEMEDVDIAVNTLATHAQLEWEQQARPSDVALSTHSVQDSFESVFNQGCYALARGRLEEGGEVVGRSAAMCLASDLSDDDKKAEMIPILIQQAYALARLGRHDEAAETLDSIDLSDVDASTAALHRINRQVLSQGGGSNPFLIQKAMSELPEIPREDKVFAYQGWRIECDKHIADLQTQKYGGVAKSISKKLGKSETPIGSARISGLAAVRAAAEAEMGTGKAAIRKLTPLLASRPDDVGLLLTVIQLYANMENYAPAISLLEDFGERMETKEDGSGLHYRFLPGLVAVRVALLQKQGRHSAARSELAKAATYWIENTHGVGARSLLREAGIQLIHSSEPKDLATAGRAFEKLARDAGSDEIAEAGFVASVATTDYVQVEPYLDGLEGVDDLVEDIDVDELLEKGVVSFPAQIEKQARKRALEADASARQAVKPPKKRRLRKLPKDYVEGKAMDPERWLPLKDRSTYRPKGKKGKKKAMEATQGGPVKGDTGEVLELVGGAGAVKVEKASGGGGGGAKKKKKGKK